MVFAEEGTHFWNDRSFSADELQYLEESTALIIFHVMAQALLVERPAREAIRDVLRRVLDTTVLQDASPAASAATLSTSVASSRVVGKGPDVPTRSHRSSSESSLASLEDYEVFWRRLNGEGEYEAGSTLRLLRQDPITKRWVFFMVQSKGANEKPQQYKKIGVQSVEPRAHECPTHDKNCPLCTGNEEETEVLRVWPDEHISQLEGLPADADDKEKWLVRVLRNPFPYLLTPPELYTRAFPGSRKKFAACFGDNDNIAARDGAEDASLYLSADGFGASEVVVESPTHNALIGISTEAQLYHSLRAITTRGRSLRKCSRVFQLLYFKQYGADAGGSLIHPHFQICSLPIVSGSMSERLRTHQDFFEAHGVCAVQKLYVDDVCGDHPLAVSRLVCQTEHFVASIPYAHVARGRVVIAPRRQRPCFEDCSEEELKDLAAMLRALLAALYRLRDDPPYNLYWESAPTRQALQSTEAVVPDITAIAIFFCWTLHIRVPQSISGFGFASGIEVTKQLPEQEARELRGALLQEMVAPIRAELFEGGAGPPNVAALRFPEALGPYMMIPSCLFGAVNKFYRKHPYPKPDPTSNQSSMIGIDPCYLDLGIGDVLFCQISPLHSVTLDLKGMCGTRASARIPESAQYYAWVYPAIGEECQQVTTARTADKNFLKHGGFIYFDANMDSVATSIVSHALLGTGLLFGCRRSLPVEAAELLTRQGRFHPVTLEHMARRGATHYAFIQPSEFEDSGMNVKCPSGAFAYKFSDAPPVYFPTAKNWTPQRHALRKSLSET